MHPLLAPDPPFAVPEPDRASTDPALAARRSADDVLLAELSAPPALEDAQESLAFWRARLEELPVYRRAERREAHDAVERWEQHVRDAQRALYGPGLVEQLLESLGIRWRPQPRQLMLRLGAVAVVLALLVVALAVAVVVFWPQIEPIVRTLLNGGG